MTETAAVEIAAVEIAQDEDRSIRELLRDLHVPKPLVFWADLLFTALVGWSAFAYTATAPLSRLTLVSAAISVFALYRGLCFVHEISHLNSRSLKGFEVGWNLLFGFPLLMPSFVYAGVHQYHHKLSTYGTKQDPEYLPFAQSAAITVVFAMQSLLVPVLLSIRFLVLTPIGFASRKFENWIVAHASSLTMNVVFRREVTAALLTRVRLQSAIVWAIWMAFASATVSGAIPWRVWGTWLFVSSIASLINTLRTLGAHAYESSGTTMDRKEQLLDSIDTPGAFWTELWAPVGLRYHALHHYLPGIPYHNLSKAYVRLIAHLPASATYHATRSRSLPHSLKTLVGKGLTR